MTLSASILEGQAIRPQFDGTNNDPLIYNATSDSLASHADIQDSLPNNRIAEKVKKWLWKKPDSYFKNSDGALIPLEAVYVGYDVGVTSETFISHAQNLIRGIIKDVASGEQRFIKT